MQRLRIDTHHHIMPPRYVTAVGAHPIGSQGVSGRVPDWSLRDSLMLMDEAGISAAVTSISAPGLAGVTGPAAAELARYCNEFAAGMVRDHPTRFGMFACLPMDDLDAALDEAGYAHDTLFADGVCLMSHYDGRYLGERDFHPLYEELNRRKSVVFVHPTTPVHPVQIGGLSVSMLEFPFDTTRAIASLIFGGVIHAYPGIRWIFSHAGGAMPYLSGRLEMVSRVNPRLREYVPEGLPQVLRSLYFDCALSANPVHFAALRALVDDTQILFGTDYPFGPKRQMAETVDGIDSLHLPPEAKSSIEFANALRLFPRLRRPV
jgi:predicted TIM-barrel fold metal-dependent hydrolase